MRKQKFMNSIKQASKKMPAVNWSIVLLILFVLFIIIFAFPLLKQLKGYIQDILGGIFEKIGGKSKEEVEREKERAKNFKDVEVEADNDVTLAINDARAMSIADDLYNRIDHFGFGWDSGQVVDILRSLTPGDIKLVYAKYGLRKHTTFWVGGKGDLPAGLKYRYRPMFGVGDGDYKKMTVEMARAGFIME